jgi:HEAT repeat protein
MQRSVDRYRAFQDALVTGLASPSARVRYDCAHALDRYGDASTRAPLARLMDDAVPRVRWMAMHALSCHACGEKAGALEDHIRQRMLAAAKSDPSPDVRRHAAAALALAHDVRSAPALREVLHHETDGKVRRGVAWALSELGRSERAAV